MLKSIINSEKRKSSLMPIENDNRNCINFKLKLKTYKHHECSYLNRFHF